MNEELLNKIQKRIEADNIQPLPRWRFILLRTSFWLLAILSVIVGSFAVGTILFLFSDYSRHNLPPIPRDISEVLLMIPYLWIILFLFFIAVAQISIEHTKKGYQYKIHTVIVSSVLLSIIFGSILNYIGASRATHKSLHQYTIYNSVIYDSRDAYSRPKFGRLAGTITTIEDAHNFSITDFHGRIWQIHTDASTTNFIPKASTTIQMFGILEASSSIFLVKNIRAWSE